MQDRSDEFNKVIRLVMIGILGVLVTTLSDFFLLGRPVSGAMFFKLSTESMVEIAHWRITFGTILGVIALPFEVLGLAPLYYGLKLSGRILPIAVVIADAHALLMGVAFHMSYAFMGSGWKLYYNQSFDPEIAEGLLDQYEGYWKLLLIIVLVDLLTATILFSIIILKRKSQFPRWMVIINPLISVLLVLPVVYFLPAPVGGYIAPAVLNIATLIFIIVTLMLYRNDRRKELQSNKENVTAEEGHE